MKRNDRRALSVDSATPTQKEQVTYAADEGREDVPEYNEYYLNVSIRFRTAKIICVFSLCIFVLSSMLIFGKSLTYENARYILRDLGQILSEDSGMPVDKITLDASDATEFAVFRGSIVVCGVSGVSIYSPTGTQKLKDETTFTSPVAVSSDKYCIVYSLGAYNLSIYNSVARVYDMKFEYPIYDVALSDNGNIAVLTQSKEYKCVVYTYDSDFKQTAAYNKSEYPVAVEYSDTSENLYIAAFGTNNGSYYTKLESFAPKSDSASFSVTLDNTLPYDISITDENNIIMAVQKGLVYISQNGEVLSEIINTDSITDYHLTNTAASILTKIEKQMSFSAYGSEGDLIFETDRSDVVDAYYFSPYICIQEKNTLTIINEDGSERMIDIGFGAKKILNNDGYVYVCYSDCVMPFSLS